MTSESTYQEIVASSELSEFVHSFWTHQNHSDKPEQMTISPDSFFKVIFIRQEGKITSYFMTGLWTKSKEFTIAPRTSTFGCRLKILAPEFLIGHEIASILDKVRPLERSFLNIERFSADDFSLAVAQWESELLKIKSQKVPQANKLRLSQLLYKMNGSLAAKEVSEQIYWTNRQINRYLNRYLGVSLKKYLNIQKCYTAYLHIREGKFYPEQDYFDQSHFIREVKKHTGETPSTLHERQNDRFIQLKNIKGK